MAPESWVRRDRRGVAVLRFHPWPAGGGDVRQHLAGPGPPARRASPRRPPGPARRPGHPGHQRLPGPIRAARRRRRHHPPGRRRHRHAARPLPRTSQDPPGTHQRRGRAQPDPAARLVERASAGPDPHQPPRPPRTRPRLMNTNQPAGSFLGRRNVCPRRRRAPVQDCMPAYGEQCLSRCQRPPLPRSWKLWPGCDSERGGASIILGTASYNPLAP